MMVTVNMIVWWWWVWFHQSKIYNHFTQICRLLKSNRNPTAQIFLMFLQRLRTGNSTNSRPIQTNSFNIWTKTWESNTKRLTITTRVKNLWNNNIKILTKSLNLQNDCYGKDWKRQKRVSIESGKSPGERFRQCLSSYFQNGGSTKKRYTLPPHHHHKAILGVYATSTGLDLKR